MRRNKRIIIAAREKMLQDGLMCIAQSSPNVTVVSETASGLDAIKECHRLKPHLLIAQAELPQVNGLVVARTVASGQPPVAVILLLDQWTRRAVSAAQGAGPVGILTMADGRKELRSAIAAALNGKPFLSPRLRRLEVPRQEGRDMGEPLTPRELQVLALVAEGHRNRKIADLLKIKPKTVDSHRTNIIKKLDLHSTAALTRYAIRKGLA